MSALSINNLARRHRESVTQIANALEIKAQIVNVTQDGRETFVVVGQTNKIWVKLYGGDDNDIYEAYNTAVEPKAKMFVFVRLDGGEYFVTRQAPREATDYLGEAASSFATPDKIGDLSKTIIPARNYEPGAVYLVNDPTGSSADLVVGVKPFWYPYYGEYKRFPGGAINLAAYAPATTDYWQWALVAVWGYDNALHVVTGSEYAGAGLLTDNNLGDLTIEGLFPCDALKVQEGATTITRSEYFQYGRLSATTSELTANPITLASAYHHLPSNRRARWDGPITLTGDLVLEGELTII